MSEVNIKFTPLYGAQTDGPLSYLLQVNSFTFLLDCGWTDPYDASLLQPLVKNISNIDAVIISHPDPQHLGALPYLVGKLDLTAPIYATGAVHKMGQMFMYSTYLTRHVASDFSVFDLDDVDTAFGKIHQLRFKQEVALTGPGSGITITPLPAGHLLGGAVWKISAGGEDCIYSVDFNHKRERHLTAAPLDSSFLRPAALIADAGSVGRMPSDRDKTEKQLLEVCLSTLRSDGNVLIPIDAAGRLLEFILLFESYWAEHRLPYPVIVLGPMVHTTLEFARSQLEWMNESLVKSFGHSKDNPFIVRHVKLCTSLSELKKVHGSNPKVVLAVEPSMMAGPSRHLFADWGSEAKNTVVIGLEPEKGSLAWDVLEISKEKIKRTFSIKTPASNNSNNNNNDDDNDNTSDVIEFVLSKRVPLKGEELTQHLEQEKKKREEEEEAAAANAMQLQDIEMKSPRDALSIGSDGVGGVSPRSQSVKSIGSLGTHGSARRRSNSTRIDHAAERRDAVVFDENGAPIQNKIRGNIAEADEERRNEGDEDYLYGDEGDGACLVEGFEVPLGSIAPMFPHEDEWERVDFDEYGEKIEFADFDVTGRIVGRLGKALKSEAAAERGPSAGTAMPDRGGTADALNTPGGGGGGDVVTEGDLEVVPEIHIPTKIDSKKISFPLLAQIIRLDFDGRSDERSVQTMLAHVAPRTALLTHGPSASTSLMSTRLEKELEGLYSTVLTPVNGEEVVVGVGASFEIALDDTLMHVAAMHAVSGYELAWVDGVVMGPDESIPMEEVVENNNGGDIDVMKKEGKDACLQTLLPRASTALHAASTPATAPTENNAADAAATATETTYGGVFIGDVRLSELKKALAAVGIASEFHGGALYCAGQVVVKRRGDGNGLLLEGAFGDGWFKVKECLASMYHVC